MSGIRIAFVGDDFTGACDTLATLARSGLRTRLHADASGIDAKGLDAVGLATGLRAMSMAEGRAAMSEIAPRVAGLRAGITHLKICSTFDSAPETGNICVSADILGSALSADWTVIVGGQPSLGRYCLFGNLFAALSDGTVYRIDRHPVMRAHPTTPMGEADLRRHLAAQGWADIGLIDYRAIGRGAEDLAMQIETRIAAGERRTLVDVASQADLGVIGTALRSVASRRRILCVGASSVAEALVAAGLGEGTNKADAAAPELAGPILAVAGSRSQVTAGQVAAAARYERLDVEPMDFAPGAASARNLAVRCAGLLAEGRNVLVALGDQRTEGLGGRELAASVAAFIAATLSTARPGCLVVAGGDTSSAAIAALPVAGIEFVADLDRGVPLVRAAGSGWLAGMPMVLKGGQMGAATLFDDIAARTAASVPRARP